MLPDLGTGHAEPDLSALSARKAAGARSRLTRKSVADSYEEHVVEGRIMSAIDCRFAFTAPPRVAPERVMRLARFHLQGFFYLITYDEQRRGGAGIGDIGWIDDARRPDWGNDLQRGFADYVSCWNSAIEGIGADGYFKIAIRREPSGDRLWSFALEWNKALRSIGFFGDLQRAQKHADLLPPLRFQQLDARRRMRLEVSLDPKDDRLFLPIEEIIPAPRSLTSPAQKNAGNAGLFP